MADVDDLVERAADLGDLTAAQLEGDRVERFDFSLRLNPERGSVSKLQHINETLLTR